MAERKEFFEVFGKKDESTGQPAPTTPARPKPVITHGDTMPHRAPSVAASPQSRPGGVALTRGRLVGIAAGAGGFVVLAFLLGITVGRSHEEKLRPPILTQEGDAMPHRVPPAPEAPNEIYRLRIVSGIREQSAGALVQHLKSLGYAATISSIGGTCAVDVGEFNSSDSPEARAFRQQFRNMEYESRKQFEDCRYVKYVRKD